MNSIGFSSEWERQLMINRTKWVGAIAASALALFSSAAMAEPILRITEIWAGQEASDLTVDWFELTNFGDMPWVAGVSPVLTVNDNGGALMTDDLVEGLADIQPGESAIILMEGTAADKQTFFDVWNPVKPQVVLENIGYADGEPDGGLGLSSGGDGIRVWLNDVLQDSKDYNNPPSGVSWDVLLGAYSTVNNAAGAKVTLALNDAAEPAVGSPGTVFRIPEPAASLLLILGATAFVTRARWR
jgi:hypothetical protein